ncbi:MAG TPA: hypothetical protein VHT30_08270 [Acidimicrobiales bacterium]|nr:hypothetical protein [Acidimicrobiales bacterium]
MSDDPSAERRPGPPVTETAVMLDPMSERPGARFVRRVRRHWYWARTEGFGRLIEEDDLHPLARAWAGAQRYRWRRAHPIEAGTAVPVFLVGLQRSGTNMLTRALAASREFEVYNENDRRAFERFRLRPDGDIERLVETCRSRYVLFKPLCDSHRTGELLDRFGGGGPRAVWMFRSVEGRIASAVAKFGDVNLRVLAAIAAGEGDHTWQAQGISSENRDLLRRFDYDAMSAESAAALFWYIRHSLFFDLGLDRRDDATIVSWDGLVAQPDVGMRSLCAFLGLAFQPALFAHFEHRTRVGGQRADIDPVIRERCEALHQRLEGAARAAVGG